MMRQLPPQPSRQEAFKDLVMNFILDQEEKVRQLEEYICVIGSDFMQLSSEVVEKLIEEIKVKKNKFTKIKKSRGTPTLRISSPLMVINSRKLSQKRHLSIHLNLSHKSHSLSNTSTQSSPVHLFPQSSPQVLPSFEVYTPPMTYPEEVEETIGIPMEVEPLDHTKLEDLGLNTCSHDIFLSSREISSVDESEP
ncbi:hypothetical protein Tco_0847194 [Tanacetum coccineum]